MQLDKYKQREKDALAAQRELNALHKQAWNGKWLPCKPFQHGWIRDWELRPDIAARKDAENFRLILRHIGTNQWCKDTEFLRYCSRRSRKGQRLPMDPPFLKCIPVRPNPVTGEETGWPNTLPAHLKKYFYFHPVNTPFCSCFPSRQYFRPAHYVFRTPWMFQLRVRPAFISKLPAVDGDLESKIALLNRHMECRQYWPLLHHMRDYGWDRRGDTRAARLARIENKELE